MGKKATPNDKADSIFDPREIAKLIDDLRYHSSQQQFSPEQIKDLQTNLAQISSYSLGKVNDNLRKVITEFKTVINPIDEKISLIKFPQNIVSRKEIVFSVDKASKQVLQ